MKTILATFLTILMLVPVSAMGEIQTITHTVKQAFGGSQSADDALISAIAKAKREALEMAGVYVEALTIVKDAKVDKDEILALTAGVLKSEVVSQKNYVSGDGFGIEIVVKIIVDPSILEGRVTKLLQDRTHLEQLNQSRKKEKELLDKMATLEKENRQLMAKKESSKDLKKKFETATQGLTAVDWFDKASALWDGGKYTDPQKAIEYLSQAIRLKPDYAYAYVNRGAAYVMIEQYQQAISDYNEGIRLAPYDALAYNNRGLAYGMQGQFQRAMEDYSQAIRLKSDYVDAYVSRGMGYNYLQQYQRAIVDLNHAIRLKPDEATAYNSRGDAYSGLGQIQWAIEDWKKAIRINPNDTFACALAWNNLTVAYIDTRNLAAARNAVRELQRHDTRMADNLFNLYPAKLR